MSEVRDGSDAGDYRGGVRCWDAGFVIVIVLARGGGFLVVGR